MNYTILNSVSGEIVEKKSKFIANIYKVKNKEEAEEKIKEIKKKYFDARHNCSAYRILEKNTIIEKGNDDGEPAGTAGAPILNILQKNNLVNIVVIVTRYFGGILLGTGGLVRSYSEATLIALEKAEKAEVYVGKEYEVKIDYSNLENLKFYCKKNNINISKIEYSNEIICNLEIREDNVFNFENDIKNKNINILNFKEVKDNIILNF